MVLQLIALFLVLAIVFYQVVQGLFSALIMMMLTILCAAVAFEYYEPMAVALLYKSQGSCAEAASLLTLFVLPLLGLRIVFDMFIPWNVVMGQWVDRVGGGVIGLVTALILVGVFCTVIVLLPFGESIIGYTSHDQALEEDQGLFPMSFTLGLVDGLSKLGLGAGTGYSEEHPDFARVAFCARNTAGRSGRLDTPTDALKVIAVFEPRIGPPLPDDIPISPPDPTRAETQPAPAKLVLPRNPLVEGTAQKFLIVRVSVSEEARNNEDNWWRLPGTHFRLVSQTQKSYWPVAYLTALAAKQAAGRQGTGPELTAIDWKCHVPPKDEDDRALLADLCVERRWFKEGGPADVVVDWVYSIPADEKIDRIIFRRVAIERVPDSKLTTGWPANPDPEKARAVFRIVRR